MPLAEGITWVHVLIYAVFMGAVIIKTNHLQERWDKEGDD